MFISTAVIDAARRQTVYDETQFPDVRAGQAGDRLPLSPGLYQVDENGRALRLDEHVDGMVELVSRALDPEAWAEDPEASYPFSLIRVHTRRAAANERARAVLTALNLKTAL